MALAKITPIHQAIAAIDEAIKIQRQARADLIALLPVEKKKPRRRGENFIVHPLTGKKGYY